MAATQDIEDCITKHGRVAARTLYNSLIESKLIQPNVIYELKLKEKRCRSWSGVLVVTVVMRPDKFSCSFDCKYCPDEPGQPRSYLSSEPAVARANRNEFDAVKQFNSRLDTLQKNGHTLNKIEIIVLGGTFSTYPRNYQTEFIRDLFYAANTYSETGLVRDKMHILDEQRDNESAKYRIIGISLETRPDLITKYELLRFRMLGCTRVQIGIQHTNDEILLLINRGHTAQCSVDAIRLLKNYGFKVDAHIMPDLPGSTPALDKLMMEDILSSSDYQPDYLKIYPCLDVEHTEIRQWKQDGRWTPYAEREGGKLLLDVCMYAKQLSRYHIRFNRIQRDFPEERPGVIGYCSENIRSNFRQTLQNECAKQGITCRCIRCREVRHNQMTDPNIYVDSFEASGVKELFISCASKDRNVLYGFVRLRLGNENIHGAALVRELHVYGDIQDLKIARHSRGVQHRGIGKVLMAYAELYAFWNTKQKMCVISGVGVRGYYRKLGYHLVDHGYYMIKSVSFFHILSNLMTLLIFHLKTLRSYT